MTLLERIRDLIEVGGSMPFDEFMDLCLYDPDDGYFATGPLRSVKAGDFLTSPEVSPLFGRMLARFFDRERTPGAILVEVGAGSGSLLRSLLPVLAVPPSDTYAIEASSAARRQLAEISGVRVGSSLEDLPGRFDGVVVANELLDNLPVRIAIRSDDGWDERHVVTKDGQLAYSRYPARDETVAWADEFSGPIEPGGLVEVQIHAGDYITAVLERLDAGVFVVIDYGDTADGLSPRRNEGTLRTYRGHHLGPDPLLEPGSTDITADVNFTAIVAAAEEAGAAVDVLRQDDFLRGLGLEDEIADLRRHELDAAVDPGDAMRRLQLRSDRTDAVTLLHPRGLGDFRVAVMRKT